jgi:hypothetical protein
LLHSKNLTNFFQAVAGDEDATVDRRAAEVLTKTEARQSEKGFSVLLLPIN